MKLLTLLAIATSTCALVLPSSPSIPHDVAPTKRGDYECSMHLTWTQQCYRGGSTHATPFSITSIRKFFKGDTLIADNAGKGWQMGVGHNGDDRWTLNEVMPSPFVVREYDDPLKLVFEYQGCWFDTVGGSGCGHCNVGAWTSGWDKDTCEKDDTIPGQWGQGRTADMDCFFHCIDPPP